MTKVSSQPAFVCSRCQAAVRPGRGDFYVVRIEAIADPTPPEITDDDLARDHRGEISELLARLDGFSEQELLNQVYRRLNLILCSRCCSDWIADPVGGG